MHALLLRFRLTAKARSLGGSSFTPNDSLRSSRSGAQFTMSKVSSVLFPQKRKLLTPPCSSSSPRNPRCWACAGAPYFCTPFCFASASRRKLAPWAAPPLPQLASLESFGDPIYHDQSRLCSVFVLFCLVHFFRTAVGRCQSRFAPLALLGVPCPGTVLQIKNLDGAPSSPRNSFRFTPFGILWGPQSSVYTCGKTTAYQLPLINHKECFVMNRICADTAALLSILLCSLGTLHSLARFPAGGGRQRN